MPEIKNIWRKILIVEDEEMLASNLAAFLAQVAGAEVVVAPSGEQAVLEAARFAPHCVLTDYNLPGINGIETARLIRARDPETSFVLMTGYPSEAVFAAARDYGAQGILVKPFALAELRACLSAA